MAFGTKTLQGNWCEDRCQPGDGLSATAGFSKRKARETETGIAYIGERYDVLSRLSRMPPRVSYATPDDGFRERDTTNKVDFAHPNTRPPAWSPPKPTMVTSQSVPEVSFTRAPKPERWPRSETNQDQRYFTTSVGEFYGYGDGKGFKMNKTKSEPNDLSQSGLSTEHEGSRSRGMKCGQLCGENYQRSSDPAIDTHCQRAWLYQTDAALQNIHLGGAKKKPSGVDNVLSLPIGDGAMAKVREDLKRRDGRLFRAATTITKGLGSRSGINIFQDG